jgi:c-di-GMP-binding flagellar brake protein YcgR
VASGEYKGIYSARVREVKEKHFVILAPIKDEKPVPLRSGTPCHIYFTLRDQTYMFETRVLNRELTPVPILTLTRPPESQIRKSKRNEKGRFSKTLKVEYRILPKTVRAKGITQEIDENGLRLKADRYLAPRSVIEMTIMMPGSKTPIKAMGTVLAPERAVDAKAASKEARHEAEIEFMDGKVSKNDQKRIATEL